MLPKKSPGTSCPKSARDQARPRLYLSSVPSFPRREGDAGAPQVPAVTRAVFLWEPPHHPTGTAPLPFLRDEEGTPHIWDGESSVEWFEATQ